MSDSTAAKKAAEPQKTAQPPQHTASTSAPAGKKAKPQSSLNDLEKDLDKGNARVVDLLNEHAVKQGYHNPDDYTLDKGQADQNDPDNVKVKDHSAEMTAEEVAEEATKDQEKQDKAREAKFKKASDDKS